MTSRPRLRRLCEIGMRSRWPHASRTSGLTPKPDLHLTTSRRREEYGSNELPASQGRSRLRRLGSPVHQSPIVVLLVAGGVTLLLVSLRGRSRHLRRRGDQRRDRVRPGG